jgi:dUTP pyrophosphatase
MVDVVNDLSFYKDLNEPAISTSLKFQLQSGATAPTRSHDGDLGYDLYANETISIEAGDHVNVSTGVAFQFPSGWGGFVKDRSSMAMNTTVEVIAGVIDNGYTGECSVVFANYGPERILIKQGDKIAQMVMIPLANFPLEEVENITSPDGRGSNGFGSTGK